MSYRIHFLKIWNFWVIFETVALQFVKDIIDLPSKTAKLIGGDKIF